MQAMVWFGLNNVCMHSSYIHMYLQQFKTTLSDIVCACGTRSLFLKTCCTSPDTVNATKVGQISMGHTLANFHLVGAKV